MVNACLAAARLATLLTVSAASLMIFWHPPAAAGDLNLLLNGKAIHIDAPAGSNFNERNWGFGVQYDFDSTDGTWIPFLTASQFRDSYDNTSYYAGGGLSYRSVLISQLHADIGVVGFLMTREDYKDGDPFPGILPVLSFGTDRVALNVSYVPKVHPKLVELVFLQLKIFFTDF